MSRDDRFIEPGPMAVPCIRCNKSLQNMYDQTNHPGDAVVFSARGQYGSTQFDPGDGSYLEINLCDNCLIDVAKSHVVSFPPKAS